MRRLILLAALAVGGCASASAGPPHPSAPVPAGRTALVAHLSILRRPAARTDSEPALRATLRQLAHVGCESLFADPGFSRLATVTRDGTRVYVVAFRPGSCVPRCTGTAQTCMRPLPRQEMVAVIPVTSGPPYGQYRQYATLRGLEAGIARSGDQSTQFVLVPDGVVRVVLQITGGERPYALTATVRNNLAVFPRQNLGTTMLWLNARGRIVGPARLY